MSTNRERFKQVIHHKKPDILPWVEIIFEETLMRWFREGLPADEVTVIGYEIGRGGTFLSNWPTFKGFGKTYDRFGCQSFFGCMLLIDVGPVPRFKQRKLGETEKHTDFLTETGAIVRRPKRADFEFYAMPQFIEFPVKDKKTWYEYKKRLNPEDPRRYPKDWDTEGYIEQFETYQKGPTLLRFNGFYGFGAELMSIPRFVTAFYKDPELIREMLEHWEYFTIETIREAVETLKDKIDVIYWWEDMAERHGPCISPKLFREFLLPHYKRVTGFLKKNGIDRIMFDSDGNLNPLLDEIIEAGGTGLWPLEVNSGMDALEIKQKYGDKFFLIGNLDKRELAKGGEEMKKEVDSKVPILKDLGGYIPSADHVIQPEFSLDCFREYMEYMKSILPY